MDNNVHSLDCRIVKEYLSGRIILPKDAPQCTCHMKNPFNPDHHEIDQYPELHASLQSLGAHEKKVIAAYGALSDEHKKIIAATDALLACCPNNECDVCGSICCPKGDEMHFHHDGCPSCS